MGKKRRQQDNNADGSEDSTESGEGYNKGSECPHFMKAVNLGKLRKVVKDKKWSSACLDCQKHGDPISNNEDELSNEPPRLWICLQCGNVACGREQKSHAKEHYETPRSDSHYLVIDTYQWSVWCYKCDEAVTRNGGHKKRLLEITDLLKKWGKANTPLPLKPQIPLCQNETLSMDNEKKKNLNDLPKVGGLANLGNTCFFNAVMQCLAQTPYLVKVLDDLQVPGQKFVLPGGKFKGNDDEEIELPPIEGILETPGSFTPVLRKTLTDMQNSDGQVYRPTELLNSLRKKTMQCTDGGQHDSHELLRHLLELVRNEDVRRYQSIILKEKGLSGKTKPQCVDENLKSRVKFYGNQANAKFLGPERVFRGELISTIQCLDCSHSSIRTEPFLDLSLPILIDMSLPPILKRKNNSFENSVDSMGNNIFNRNRTLSRRELMVHKADSKRNRMNKRKNGKSNYGSSNASRISEEKKGNIAESEESDADIEDNIETEDVPIQEVAESGYSSEKPSTVTSPDCLSEFPTQNVDNVDLNVSPVEIDISTNTFDCPPLTSESNINFNYSPSPTDVPMIDIRENKNNEISGLNLSTTLVNSDFTSPEGPTISPLSSPLTSKDSPTSPISSAIDGDDVDKRGKIAFSLTDTEKRELSDKENSLKTTSIDLADENLSTNKETNTTKKLTNGIGDITSNITKLGISSFSESPTRSYPTKEGECSVLQCLNQFTGLELMSLNNKVGCTACTERENKGKKDGKMVCTDSTKQYLISRVPAVLILHLKRFQVQKFSFRKVGKHVSFPMVFDLAAVSKDYTKPKVYALYGVVEHSGTLYGGHYVAYVKSRAPLKPNDPRWSFLPKKDGFESNDTSSESNSELESDEASGAKTPKFEPPPGRWYYVSDSRVHEVDEKTVLNSEAYLLFYERIL